MPVFLRQVYTAFDTHLDALGVYKLDTVGDAFVVVAGLDGFKSKEASVWIPYIVLRSRGFFSKLLAPRMAGADPIPLNKRQTSSSWCSFEQDLSCTLWAASRGERFQKIEKRGEREKSFEQSQGGMFVTYADRENKTKQNMQQDHAMAMVKYAFRTLFELERIKTEEDLKFEMRVGLHTGPCIGGVIGMLKPR